MNESFAEYLTWTSVGIGVGATVRTLCIILGSLMQFISTLVRAVLGV